MEGHDCPPPEMTAFKKDSMNNIATYKNSPSFAIIVQMSQVKLQGYAKMFSSWPKRS